jgi:hypothetical protein
MAVVFTLLNGGNQDNRLQYCVTMASADPAVLKDPLPDVGAGQVLLRKVLSELVAASIGPGAPDGFARALLGLREETETGAAFADQRVRVSMVPERVGVMPSVTAVRDAGTGRAFLSVQAGTTSAGALAVTKVILTLELLQDNMKADGSSV